MAAKSQQSRTPGETSQARERILEAAYALFATHGIGAVGVDAIVARSGVAKMSLYRHFQSKEGLVLAFLTRREQRWTVQWLEAEVLRRASDPGARLLAIFDVLHEWFQRDDFEGCSFVTTLIQSKPGSAVRRAAVEHLANMRAVIEGFAAAADLHDPAEFAQTWHMLIKGAVVAVHEGNRGAARAAHRAGILILQGWQGASPARSLQ